MKQRTDRLSQRCRLSKNTEANGRKLTIGGTTTSFHLHSFVNDKVRSGFIYINQDAKEFCGDKEIIFYTFATARGYSYKYTLHSLELLTHSRR